MTGKAGRKPSQERPPSAGNIPVAASEKAGASPVHQLTGLSALQAPVRTLPGIAAKRAAQFERLGIRTYFDLLCWFPREYEDWSQPVPLASLKDGEEQLFSAVVSRQPTVQRKGRLTLVRTVLRDGPAVLTAIWFNQPWQAEKLRPGKTYRFYGRIKRDGKLFSVQNPVFEPEEEPGDASAPGQQATMPYRPVYPLTEGVSQPMMRRLVSAALQRLDGCLPEPLPAWLRRDHQLCAVDYAYRRIHLPASQQDIEISRRRIRFEELFLLRASLYMLKHQRNSSGRALPMPAGRHTRSVISELIGRLPYQLTDAQNRVWQEILADLGQDRPMNRLLQGDVGSGKTVVAALAMLHCALSGNQAAMMAPTALLARQHHQTLSRILAGTGCEIALLTGSATSRERGAVLSGLADGTIRLLVGTHALIESCVRFKSLGLAITDEQHRFGVRQRMQLARTASDQADSESGIRQDGPDEDKPDPHVLVMSATPIPRSLALVIYGDLDVSVIDQIPPGRQPVATYTAASTDRPRVENLMRRMISEGRQVYVICPMIEEESAMDLESATATYNRLARHSFPDLRVGLVHGSLRQAAKDEVMDAFMNHSIDILVSTTVIEVGIDNPNAALMVIENAERFGLAQLHQLRGRIGRGPYRSVCILISDSDDELARKRLQAICHASDGFAVAEADLQLRGPGDFFGTRQHGLPPLRLANLYRDHELMAEVQSALERLIKADPALEQAEHRHMKTILAERYPDVFARTGL